MLRDVTGSPRQNAKWLAHVFCAVLAISLCFATNCGVRAEDAARGGSDLTRKQAEAILRAGYQALQAKQNAQAIVSLTRSLQSGQLRRNEIARAFYYRGLAHQAAGQTADAISDLTNALWLKGALGKKDREKAVAARKRAYASAGVGGGSNATVPRQSTAAVSVAESRSQSAQASGGSAGGSSNGNFGLGSFFGSLFSGSTTTGSTQTSSGNAVSPKPPIVSPRSPASSGVGWATRTEPAKQSVAAIDRRLGSQEVESGNYFAQIASFRTKERADRLVARLVQKHSAALGGRHPAVKSLVVGSMGEFFVVRIESFASRDSARPMCTKLIASGLDCLVKKRN
ncbi:MAG: SPOR domain-containing protein [Hyphomicrobiaceae bacterium]